jgi:hypothetical protein
MRHGKRLHGDVANLELGSGAKNSPVSMLIERAAASHGFGRLSVGVNRQCKFAAENFETTNMIAVLVSEQNAIELVGHDATLLEPEYDLAGAQPTVDQDFAMIGRDQRAISGTAAAEQSQTEHSAI